VVGIPAGPDILPVDSCPEQALGQDNRHILVAAEGTLAVAVDILVAAAGILVAAAGILVAAAGILVAAEDILVAAAGTLAVSILAVEEVGLGRVEAAVQERRHRKADPVPGVRELGQVGLGPVELAGEHPLVPQTAGMSVGSLGWVRSHALSYTGTTASGFRRESRASEHRGTPRSGCTERTGR
jgi:hypothetical protein